MKGSFILLFFGVALAFEKPVSYEETLLRNSIDELVRRTLEYVRWLQQRHEPYHLPPLPDQTLVDDDINLKFSTDNVLLSKIGDFTIDKVANNLPKLTSSFGVTLPAIHLEGNFQVTGTAFNKEVSGSGTFKVEVTKFVQTGDIQWAIVDHSLQIKELKLNYDFNDVKFEVQGLKIGDLTPAEVEDLLNTSLVNDLRTKKEFVSEKTAQHVSAFINRLFKGQSLQDVLNYLKELVASTPDPPPMPTLHPSF